MHKACMEGNFEKIQLLVSSGAHYNIKNNEGETALHIACWKVECKRNRQNIVWFLESKHASLVAELLE